MLVVIGAVVAFVLTILIVWEIVSPHEMVIHSPVNKVTRWDCLLQAHGVDVAFIDCMYQKNNVLNIPNYFQIKDLATFRRHS